MTKKLSLPDVPVAGTDHHLLPLLLLLLMMIVMLITMTMM